MCNGNCLGNLSLVEVKSKLDFIISTLNTIKEGSVERVYDTKGVCEYLKVGKSVVDKLRQSGELSYSKIGKSYVYTQSDIDRLLENNRVNYV